MKITILVLQSPLEQLAGTEIATYNIARLLAKRRHEISVITSLDEGLPKETEAEGFHVHRIKWPKVRFLGIVVFWLKALLLLKKIDPQLVHAQSIDMGMPGFLAKKFLRKPYVVWGQGSEVYLPWLFKKSISSLVMRNADAVIALTADMKKQLQRICDRDIYVIPNGVDLGNFGDLPAKKSIRRRLALPDNGDVVLFVGTLKSIKGVKYLIQAMNIIRQEDAKARLVIVGDGEEKPGLERLCGELNLSGSVTFAGKVSNEEVPQYMAAADVLAMPSLSEGLPVVLLEALASGLPIVATKVGGLPDVVEDGANGFLVEPKVPEQMAEKVLLLLRDDELRETIAKNNKEKAKTYDWESVVERLLEVYQSHG